MYSGYDFFVGYIIAIIFSHSVILFTFFPYSLF